MTNLRALSLLLFLSVRMAISSDAPNYPDDSVRAVARASLAGFLEKIPAGYEPKYGFVDRGEFVLAIPGIPLRVYTTYQDSADGEDDGVAGSPVTVNEWRVPVVVGGEFRTLLTVSVVDGVLKVVDLGGAALAREFGEFDRHYPGSHRGLFRLNRLKCDFVLRELPGTKISEGEYHPLHSARMVFGTDAPSIRSRRELFSEINRRHRESRQERR